MPSLRFTSVLSCFVLFLILLPGLVRAADAPDPVRAAGHWEGEIDLPQDAGQLQVMIDLARNGGVWTGTIDTCSGNFPDAGDVEISMAADPFNNVSVRVVLSGGAVARHCATSAACA